MRLAGAAAPVAPPRLRPAHKPQMREIGAEHMPRRSISLCDWDTAEVVTRMKLRYPAGDVLFGKIRPYFHKVGIAFTDGVASSDAVVLRAKTADFASRLPMTASSDEFVAAASQSMREGSRMPRADLKLIVNYPVMIPPLALLDEFGGLIHGITGQLRNLCFQNRKLREARDLLLPRLMSNALD